MKVFRIIICCLLLCITFAAHADSYAKEKDFKGSWEGVLHVTVNGVNTTFPFSMDITAGGYGQYGGTCILRIVFSPAEKVYIKCGISGSVAGEQFTFKDTKTIKYTLPEDPLFHWCAKSGTLHFEVDAKGEDVLVGPVRGDYPLGECLPATAELRRKKK